MTNEVSVHWYDSVDSTNLVAFRNMSTASGPTVWAARFQTMGRGQRGNVWESEAGCNLTFSLLVRPANLSPSRQFLVSEAATLGVRDYLADYGLAARVKWPNDVYVEDRKICGMLIEHVLSGDRVSASVLGIGVNLNQRDFRGGAPNPTSVVLELERKGPAAAVLPLNPQKELPRLVGRILDYCRLLDDGGEAGLARMDALYLENMYRRGVAARYLDRRTGAEFRGVIEGINEQSCLRIRDVETGQDRVFSFQEVSYIL